jgi:large subunit ribosomal protein L19
MHDLVKSLESEYIQQRNEAVPVADLRPGDTVRVFFRIVEGKRERLQPFQGVVIRKRQCGGLNDSITVRRTASHGVGVERTFPLHGPRLDRVELLRSAHVRRANLYYPRDRTGKSARLREKRRFKSDSAAPAIEEAGDAIES